jgi:lipopolysaccharide export LptBFGC system permease protein LptF
VASTGRITRYVLRELVTPTLLGFVLYLFLLLMQQFFDVAEKSLSKNLGLELTLRLFLVAVP